MEESVCTLPFSFLSFDYGGACNMNSNSVVLDEVEFEEKSEIFWLAIDSRAAQLGVNSGISRFIIGITNALVEELNSTKALVIQNKKRLKVLIVAKSEPALWIVELVKKYPHIVSFWSGGIGALQKTYDKPVWLWSTFALKRIQKLTNNQVIWFAPANFDRPLFISSSYMASRVIQVVHDNIPFMSIKGIGFIFKRQFRFLVKRTLTRLPIVLTVSNYSAKSLQHLAKKRTTPLFVIEDAVALSFGNNARIVDLEKLYLRRKKFLEIVSYEKDFEKISVLFDKIIQGSWVLGVGRNQKYKYWDLAAQSVLKAANDKSLNLWFIRVGADQKEISNYVKKCSPKEIGKIKFFENLKIIVFPVLYDFELAELYYLSSLLIHPSIAEGFGLPALEAALSGTPVIYRKNTAVDQHFSPNILPYNFWYGLDSGSVNDWANQIEVMLQDKKDSEFFAKLNCASSTRKFLVEQTSGKRFEWKDSAVSLINILLNESELFN